MLLPTQHHCSFFRNLLPLLWELSVLSKSKTQCPWPGLEPGLPNLEEYSLTIYEATILIQHCREVKGAMGFKSEVAFRPLASSKLGPISSGGGGVLPYKGLMGTCGQPIKQGIEFIIFCLNQGIALSIFVLNRMSFLGR